MAPTKYGTLVPKIWWNQNRCAEHTESRFQNSSQAGNWRLNDIPKLFPFKTAFLSWSPDWNPKAVLTVPFIWKSASVFNGDAGFQMNTTAETSVQIKVGAGFQMDQNEKTGVLIYVDAGFQLMYDSDRVVHPNPDAGFQVTVRYGVR